MSETLKKYIMLNIYNMNKYYTYLHYDTMNNIILFIEKLNAIIDDDNLFTQRNDENNKLDLRKTLYASTLTLKYSGIANVVSDLEIDNIVTVSKNALVKKRNNDVTHICIKQINDNLIDMIYDPSNNFLKPYNLKIDYDNTSYTNATNTSDKTLFINRTNKRFIACDGMQLNLNKALINNNDVKQSPNGNYGISIISSMYDVINNIPINYSITQCNENDLNKKKVNETNGFLNQLSYLTPNDIIIFDRWYFSEMLTKTLNDKNIGYIFRMKSNSRFFKNMSLGKSKIVNYLGVDVQLFKYKIESDNYYILTSITEKISIKEIKALYQKRWKNETDNKKFKYDILHNGIRSKNYNSLLVDIESVRFMSLISSFIEYVGKDDIKLRTKINSKNCLDVLQKKLLYLILFKEDGEYKKKTICRIIGIIYKTVIKIIKNRVYERKRVSPSTKWNINGNRYGNKKK